MIDCLNFNHPKNMKGAIMSKTYADFEEMDVNQLKGILNGLDITIPDLDYRKAENKQKLAQLAYDASQPEPTPEEQESAEEGRELTEEEIAERNEKAREEELDVDAVLDEISEFFGGEVEEAGQTDDEVVIFEVKSEDGNVIETGTFLQLRERMLTVQRQEQENAAAQEETVQTVDPSPEPEETDESIDDEFVAELKERLAPLARIGLKYSIDINTIKLRFGAKSQTTTLKQPIYRIVKTAEVLVRVK